VSDDRSILLIGARGFLGSHLREAARGAGLRVIVAARRPDDGGATCDLLDPDSVAACVRSARPALIVNAAGSPSVAESWRDPAATFAVNAIGVQNLLEAVSEHAPEAHVLCVSSAQAYGQPGQERDPFVESSPLRPVTPYGESKAAMEAIAGRYSRGRGLRIAIARLFNQLGPRQPPSQATAEFARDIASAESTGADRVELVVGSPGSARDFTDVRDSAGALLEISRRELVGTYNVCSGRAVALRSVIDLLEGMTPLPVEIGSDPSSRGRAGPSSSFGDPSRLREASGWEPQIPLERSLRDLLDWWRRELGGSREVPS
jgi:GDP-4-dehydro-6-deoxy-D-mannose reductase